MKKVLRKTFKIMGSSCVFTLYCYSRGELYLHDKTCCSATLTTTNPTALTWAKPMVTGWQLTTSAIA